MIPNTMRAAVLAEPGRFDFTETEVPAPKEDEVLVCLEGCGVCASNLSPWGGQPWFSYPMEPGRLGHEAWGRVVAVGTGVSTVKPGQRVAMLSNHAYAEFDVAPESSVVPLPPALDSQPFPGEPLACAWNIFQRSGIVPDKPLPSSESAFWGRC